MRPALLALLVLVLAGCAGGPEDAPRADLPPEAEAKVTPVDRFADKGDLIMSRAAAAVQVARDSNAAGQPAAVEAELAIAGTYLPRPTAADLAYAKARAAKADPEAYRKAQEVADRHSRALDDLWGKVEAEKAKARLLLAEKEAQRKADLAAKELELVQARKDKAATLFTLFGVIASAAGLALWVWGDKVGASKAEAGAVLLAGGAAASLPWVTEAEVAPWILGGLAVLLGLRLVAWAWTTGWKRKGGSNGQV